MSYPNYIYDVYVTTWSTLSWCRAVKFLDDPALYWRTSLHRFTSNEWTAGLSSICIDYSAVGNALVTISNSWLAGTLQTFSVGVGKGTINRVHLVVYRSLLSHE